MSNRVTNLQLAPVFVARVSIRARRRRGVLRRVRVRSSGPVGSNDCAGRPHDVDFDGGPVERVSVPVDRVLRPVTLRRGPAASVYVAVPVVFRRTCLRARWNCRPRLCERPFGVVPTSGCIVEFVPVFWRYRVDPVVPGVFVLGAGRGCRRIRLWCWCGRKAKFGPTPTYARSTRSTVWPIRERPMVSRWESAHGLPGVWELAVGMPVGIGVGGEGYARVGWRPG